LSEIRPNRWFPAGFAGVALVVARAGIHGVAMVLYVPFTCREVDIQALNLLKETAK
jgi:hypothetical protein